MNIGKLDRYILIETPPTAKNSGGEVSGTWTTFARVWAQVNPKGAMEKMVSAQMIAENTVIFRIRYISGLKENMRIYHNSQYYYINEISEVDRNVAIDVAASKKDNQ
jgi:SPP1 family predicted phage head-tail adaptor